MDFFRFFLVYGGLSGSLSGEWAKLSFGTATFPETAHAKSDQAVPNFKRVSPLSLSVILLSQVQVSASLQDWYLALEKKGTNEATVCQQL